MAFAYLFGIFFVESVYFILQKISIPLIGCLFIHGILQIYLPSCPTVSKYFTWKSCKIQRVLECQTNTNSSYSLIAAQIKSILVSIFKYVCLAIYICRGWFKNVYEIWRNVRSIFMSFDAISYSVVKYKSFSPIPLSLSLSHTLKTKLQINRPGKTLLDVSINFILAIIFKLMFVNVR